MSQKNLVMGPFAAAQQLIRDLDNGAATVNGDRTSRYIPVAKGTGDKIGKRVHVCLIEEKKGIPKYSWGYALHVIDDVDETDCIWFQTDSLRFADLVEILDDLFQRLRNGLPLP